MDNLYGPPWHCIVGKGFGSGVTFKNNHFLYLYICNKAIMLFKHWSLYPPHIQNFIEIKLWNITVGFWLLSESHHLSEKHLFSAVREISVIFHLLSPKAILVTLSQFSLFFSNHKPYQKGADPESAQDSSRMSCKYYLGSCWLLVRWRVCSQDFPNY